MAWTEADLTTLEKAIAQGASKVKFQDGREVTYRTVEELRAAKRDVERALGKATVVRRTRAQYGDGLS